MQSVSENKGLIITIFITIALMIGGVFMFSKKSDSSTKRVSNEILMPADSYRTSTGSAEINLVEFGDYQCPACGVFDPFVEKLLAEEGNKINFVFRHFPLTQHKNAPMASYAAEAAGAQRKYFAMHKKLYETQSEWSDLGDPTSKFVEYAKGMLLDTDKFTKDMLSKEIKDKVARDLNDGTLIGINATPT
jgi:protein-disulfide isomerase